MLSDLFWLTEVQRKNVDNCGLEANSKLKSIKAVIIYPALKIVRQMVRREVK